MEQIPGWFVVVMGIGTVFVGLICIIVICSILGLFFSKKNTRKTEVQTPTTSRADQGEVLAAIACAIAEECGTDPAGIRILSVKRI